MVQNYRQTVVVEGKSIAQSRWGGSLGEWGAVAGACAPITTLASGMQWGIKRASLGQRQRKR